MLEEWLRKKDILIIYKMKILPILNSDYYKQFHFLMYPKGLTKLYSNMTPRSSRLPGVTQVVWFGLQYYIKEYLIKQWNEEFFQRPLEEILFKFKRFHTFCSGREVPTEHIEALHKLGYMPLSIKALPEGMLVDLRVPFYTIENTDENSGWLVNFLETQMSTVIWDFLTVATIARQYRILLDDWAIKTVGNTDFVQWQGHDFSQRGRDSVESTFTQAGHLLSFTGTDTIPAILFLEEYYGANMEKELIGGSVPASEHSVMTSYGKENEIDAFRRLMQQFPTGILSIVSDSFDLWKVLTEYLSILKEEILARDGKIVIRPDSGDPVDIICGLNTNKKFLESEEYTSIVGFNVDKNPQFKGVIELLWDTFGGIVNELGYKILDSHIGAIYGDSITLERAREICERLAAKGFASTNIVLGIGSYTYNMNTRDTLGIAVKSTYCEVETFDDEDPYGTGRFIEKREIFKDPITDDGTKKSAKGLLRIDGMTCYEPDEDGDLVSTGYHLTLTDQCNEQQEKGGLLKQVFLNGKLLKEHTLAEIRERLVL